MSRSLQRFKLRCGLCQRNGRNYDLEFVRRVSHIIIVRCVSCGRVSRRDSVAARRLARQVESSRHVPIHEFGG